MDPVSAIANAAGSLFNGISSIWTSKTQLKIIKQQRLITEEMTEQERIRYRALVNDNNTELASQLLEQVQSRVDARNNVVYITIGGLILIFVVMVYAKRKGA